MVDRLLGQPLVVVLSLAFFWSWESVSPFFEPRFRMKHALRNLTISAFNGVMLALIFAWTTVAVAETTMRNQLGLLHILNLSGVSLGVVAFVLLDLWTYWWHRFNHEVPFLWRFHRTHHSDPAVDVTTATRFHIGEILFSSIIRLALIPAIGIPIETILLFDMIQLPVISFHHANIALPRNSDRLLRYILVTPFMHKVHHSRLTPETNSNFSSILSVWDRLFGSYTESKDPKSIQFGLDGFDEEQRQSVSGLFMTPLYK